MVVQSEAETDDRQPGRSRFFDDTSRHLDRFGILLILILVVIALSSVVDVADAYKVGTEEAGYLLLSYCTGAMLLLAAAASGVSRRWRMIIAILVGISLFFLTVISGLAFFKVVGGPIQGQNLPIVPVIYAALAFLAVLRRIVRHHQVTRSTLYGAISAYLLIPIMFFSLFLVVNSLGAEQFFGRQVPQQSYMYFSLTTVATIGSDLRPATDLGRLLTATEAIAGQLFLVIFMAMIVSVMVGPWRKSDSHLGA